MLPFLCADLQRVVADLLGSGHAMQNPSASPNDLANQVKKCFLISPLIYSNIQCTFLISFEIMRDKERGADTGREGWRQCESESEQLEKRGRE